MTAGLCEGEYFGRVVDGYRLDCVFGEALASHFWNDVLEDVAVTVTSVTDEAVFGGDIVTDYDSVGIASVGDALYVVQPLGVAGHVDVGEGIVRSFVSEQVPFEVTA